MTQNIVGLWVHSLVHCLQRTTDLAGALDATSRCTLSSNSNEENRQRYSLSTDHWIWFHTNPDGEGILPKPPPLARLSHQTNGGHSLAPHLSPHGHVSLSLKVSPQQMACFSPMQGSGLAPLRPALLPSRLSSTTKNAGVPARS